MTRRVDLRNRLSDFSLRSLLGLPLGTPTSSLLTVEQLFFQLLLEFLSFKGKLLFLSHLIFLQLLLVQTGLLTVLGLLHSQRLLHLLLHSHLDLHCLINLTLTAHGYLGHPRHVRELLVLLHLILTQSLNLLLSDLLQVVLLSRKIHSLAVRTIQRHGSQSNHRRVMNQLPHLLPVDLVWELVIVVIAHHQQVALQLLLLCRVELTLLVTAAALVLLTVTVVLKILLLLRLLMEVSLRLVCVLVHLLPLRSPLRIELSGVKFNPRDSRIRLTRLV